MNDMAKLERSSPLGVPPPALISMPLCAKSALADSRFTSDGWQPVHARRMLDHAGIDPRKLHTEIAAGLHAVSQGWLALRLEALWNSSPHSGALKASDWLRETGRLLADLPGDILQHAIDEAVKGAKAGFMPTVGEIRAIADPIHEERIVQERRLRALANPPQSSPELRIVQQPEGMTPDQAEEWNAIMAKAGASTRYHPDGSRYEVSRNSESPRVNGPARRPTRADYIELGVDPAVLDQISS